MVSVLLVEDDEPFLALVRGILEGLPGVRLTEARSARGALQRLKQGGVDILLTELTLADGDGLELLDKLGGVSPKTVPIVMSGGASMRTFQSALRMGAVDVLSKPFSRDEVERAIGLAMDSLQGFRGSIHGLSLVDLLQVFHLAKRSIGVEVRGGRGTGLVMLSAGELVHAETSQLQGEVALMHLLTMEAGSMATVPYRQVTPTIFRNFQEVLLDGFRMLDEQEQPPPRESSMPVAHPSVLPLAPNDEAAPLRELISQLDSELGAAVLWPELRALVPARFLSRDWRKIAALGERIVAQAGQGWRRIEWVGCGLGLALLRPGDDDPVVVLAQRFIERLDDRRFRWNTARVGRFIDESKGRVAR